MSLLRCSISKQEGRLVTGDDALSSRSGLQPLVSEIMLSTSDFPGNNLPPVLIKQLRFEEHQIALFKILCVSKVDSKSLLTFSYISVDSSCLSLHSAFVHNPKAASTCRGMFYCSCAFSSCWTSSVWLKKEKSRSPSVRTFVLVLFQMHHYWTSLNSFCFVFCLLYFSLVLWMEIAFVSW